MLTLESIPIPNPNILYRVIDDEAVLVMPEQGKVKVVNEVGAVIWSLLDNHRTIQEIIQEICSQFEVDENTAEKDTIKFISDLVEREIVSIAK